MIGDHKRYEWIDISQIDLERVATMVILWPRCRPSNAEEGDYERNQDALISAP